MGKFNRNTRIAKQNRNYVNYHRDWNKILIKESIKNTTQPISIISNPIAQSNETTNTPNEKKLNSQEKLRRWALKYNISKRAVSDLLKILISIGLIWLPKDSRSLLSTPRTIELITLSNGKLW